MCNSVLSFLGFKRDKEEGRRRSCHSSSRGKKKASEAYNIAAMDGEGVRGRGRKRDKSYRGFHFVGKALVSKKIMPLEGSPVSLS